MTALRDGEFELDGYLTGKGHPVHAFAFEPGSAETRNQDVANPHDDSLLMGRDRQTPTTWVFEFSSQHGEDKAAARAALNDLHRHWADRSKRTEPGQLSVLRYGLAGRTRRVYGRARRFAPVVGSLFSTGKASAVADFQTADTLHYADEEQRLTLDIVPPTQFGLTEPLTAPLTTSGGGERQGIIQVDGDAPAHLTATIHGPISDPWVGGAGWRITLDADLAYDQSVTIDSRTKTVLRNDGASMAGALSRSSYLMDVRVDPGPQEIIFGGTDQTGTARCVVAWRPAYYGI